MRIQTIFWNNQYTTQRSIFQEKKRKKRCFFRFSRFYGSFSRFLYGINLNYFPFDVLY